MGFIQPCFIRKSTKDLTEKVYRIGGRSGRGYWHSDINTLLVCESDQYRCLDDEWGNAVSLTKKGYINCGTNEELFLAIAALRDDDISLNDKINEINKKYGTKIEFRR